MASFCGAHVLAMPCTRGAPQEAGYWPVGLAGTGLNGTCRRRTGALWATGKLASCVRCRLHSCRLPPSGMTADGSASTPSCGCLAYSCLTDAPALRGPIAPRGLGDAAESSRLLSPPPDIKRRFHTLPSGIRLEVLCASSLKPSSKPPLLFLHGSYHAAWCFAEHFLPFFAARGHECWALSFRGQGAGDAVAGPVAGTIQQIAADVASFVSTLGAPPVIVAHSFGGLVAQLYASTSYFPPCRGLALLSSTPPCGNGPLIGRVLRSDPVFAAWLTYGFAARAFDTNAWLCRQCFFSAELPEADLLRYMKQIEASCPKGLRLLDLRALSSLLPLVPPPPAHRPPVLVMGGEGDRVVDVEGLRESAAAWGVEPVVLPGLAHDLMLDARWRAAADLLGGWLDGLGSS